VAWATLVGALSLLPGQARQERVSLGGPAGDLVTNQIAPVVELAAFFFDGGKYSLQLGSGTLISPQGHILTNAHVVRITETGCGDPVGEQTKQIGDTAEDLLVVLVSEDDKNPPKPRYVATVVKPSDSDLLKKSLNLDVALVQVTGTFKKEFSNLEELEKALRDRDRAELEIQRSPISFPFLQLGDSADLKQGDAIQVRGYPAKDWFRNRTLPKLVTASTGGFTRKVSLSGRVFLRSTASTDEGVSGGAWTDREGHLIGIHCGSEAQDAKAVASENQGLKELLQAAEIRIPPVAKFVISTETPEVGKPVTLHSTSLDFDGQISYCEWKLEGQARSWDCKSFDFKPEKENPQVTLTVYDNDNLSDSFTTTVLTFEQEYPGSIKIGDRSFSTLQEAVNEAQESDTIRISEGLYRGAISRRGSLLIQGKKKITIEGEGKREKIILMGNGKDPVIQLIGSTNITIKGLTLTHGQGGLLLQDSSEVLVENNVIKTNRSQGILLKGRVSGVIRDNQIERNLFDDAGSGGQGVMLDGVEGRLTLERNTIEKQESQGLFIQRARDVMVKNNIIQQNQQYGLVVQDSQDVAVQDNIISANEAVGILVLRSQAIIKDNQVLSTVTDLGLARGIEIGNSCLLVRGAECSLEKRVEISNNRVVGDGSDERNEIGILLLHSDTDIIGNRVENNDRGGIYVRDSSTAIIEQANQQANQVVSNNGVGIFITNAQGTRDQPAVVVRGNIIEETKPVDGEFGRGIEIQDSVGVLIEDNYIQKNAEHGITLFRAANVDIKGNTVDENGGRGIHIQDRSEAVLGKTTINQKIRGNREFGIVVLNGSQAIIRHQDISGTKPVDLDPERKLNSAILIEGCSSATIENNNITDNKTNGVIIKDNGPLCSGAIKSTIKGNEIVGNVGTGILVIDSEVVIQGNSIRETTHVKESKARLGIGIHLCQSGLGACRELKAPFGSRPPRAVISDNTIEKNWVAGIKVDKASAEAKKEDVVIQGNTVRETQAPGQDSQADRGIGIGIWVLDGAKAIITRNQILRNTGWGINIYGAETEALIENNSINETKFSCIWAMRDPQENSPQGGATAEQGAKVWVKNNTISKNGQQLAPGCQPPRTKPVHGIGLVQGAMAEEITDNEITGNRGYGIFADGADAVKACRSNTIRDNSEGLSNQPTLVERCTRS
jgi:parallel beta-helix repeat protein